MPKKQIITESSSEYVSRISREYGLYILENRAIPSVTDGLKTSQRIALHLIRTKAAKIKTVALAGEMISTELYVHGDAPACDAISQMAAPYNNNVCLIEGYGSFGTRIAPIDGIGAPRYTYVLRSKIAQECVYKDIEIVPMTENHDGSRMMPATFLPTLPLVLLNGVKGIATGWSTKILPRSLEALKNAVQEVLKHGKVITPLMPYYENYDLDIVKLDQDGKYVVSGKMKRVNTSTVVVTELPPDLSLEAFKEKLISLEEADKITDFTDHSTDVINVEIKMRRADLKNMPDTKLMEMLKLNSTVTENIVVLNWDGKSVRQYATAEELVEDFVKWRLEWYVKRYEYLLRKEEERGLFWLSFRACILGSKNVDSIPNSISKLNNKGVLKDVIYTLLIDEEIPIDEDVVEKISNLSIYKWTKEEGIDEAEKNLTDVERLLDLYEGILADPKKREKIFIKEVKDI